MGFMHPLDWTIFGSYLVAVLALGLWFAREQHSNEDFFLGGRKMSWLPVGLSMFASIFSSNSFVGLPTQAAFGNYHIYFAIITIPLLVVPVVGWVFVPLFHRLGVTSAYEYLELRFNRPIRLIGSSLFIIYTFAWMGNLLYAVSHVIEPVLGLGTDNLRHHGLAAGGHRRLRHPVHGLGRVQGRDLDRYFSGHRPGRRHAGHPVAGAGPNRGRLGRNDRGGSGPRQVRDV